MEILNQPYGAILSQEFIEHLLKDAQSRNTSYDLFEVICVPAGSFLTRHELSKHTKLVKSEFSDGLILVFDEYERCHLHDFNIGAHYNNNYFFLDEELARDFIKLYDSLRKEAA